LVQGKLPPHTISLPDWLCLRQQSMLGQQLVTFVVVCFTACWQPGNSFAPSCVAQHCWAEAQALTDVNGALVKSFGHCAAGGFGPCPLAAWDCLQDATCHSLLGCAPKILQKCNIGIQHLVTHGKQRDIVACINKCGSHGKVNFLCAIQKCGGSALKCLTDKACMRIATCVPQVLLSCSRDSFDCVFGSSDTCRRNIQCLGDGINKCADPETNIFIDQRIGAFIGCVGSKCQTSDHALDELLCVAKKCKDNMDGVLRNAGAIEFLGCVQASNLTKQCSSLPLCLNDASCAKALQCWSCPLGKCGQDVWDVIMDARQRERLASSATCLLSCEAAHRGNPAAQAFCALDRCSGTVVTCKADTKCWSAVQCLRTMSDECAMPSLEAYREQPLFEASLKCLGYSSQACGRQALSLVRDPNMARAMQCTQQCMQPVEKQTMELLV